MWGGVGRLGQPSRCRHSHGGGVHEGTEEGKLQCFVSLSFLFCSEGGEHAGCGVTGLQVWETRRYRVILAAPVTIVTGGVAALALRTADLSIF